MYKEAESKLRTVFVHVYLLTDIHVHDSLITPPPPKNKKNKNKGKGQTRLYSKKNRHNSHR